VPPFQSSPEDVGLVIEYPKFDFVKEGESFAFHIHVFNSSTGLLVTNDTVSCLFHGYLSNGSHSVEQDMIFDSNGVDFYLDIPATFAVKGMGAYVVQCNTSTEGGFISGGISVTITGEELTAEITSIYLASLIALMVLFALMILMAYQLPSRDATDEEGTILQVSNLKHLRSVLWACSWTVVLAIMFILANITLAYLPVAMIGDLFFAIYTIMFWITIIAIPLWFIWIFTGIFRDKEVKRMLERGVDMKSSL